VDGRSGIWEPPHPGEARPRAVTIPVKKGATLKEGTARSILKQAGVSEDEFFDVY
jgi:hypothetical protein